MVQSLLHVKGTQPLSVNVCHRVISCGNLAIEQHSVSVAGQTETGASVNTRVGKATPQCIVSPMLVVKIKQGARESPVLMTGCVAVGTRACHNFFNISH